MKVLLVYPRFADALWAYKHALKFLGKRSSSPPLGLLTVAAMLPRAWPKRLVDMNVRLLTNEDIEWADIILISAMLAQERSAAEVIARCRTIGRKIVAGGPLFADDGQPLRLKVDHVVIREAEATLTSLLSDLEHGCARHVYESETWPDIRQTPFPLWSLVDMKQYAMMTIQLARGCPFDCEFCNVVTLNGHRPRIKSKMQVISELENLYLQGWRGHVFVCDDNLLGNSRRARLRILPAIADWMHRHKYPFTFSAAVSLDLADDDEVINRMINAGFDRVTIGIESPVVESLVECNKGHNAVRDMLACVKHLQQRGLEVQGGFIVGFDGDPPSVFSIQEAFIQASGIATAMVSLLYAFPRTRLHERLQHENRLVHHSIGHSAYGAINHLPTMGRETLISGHKSLLANIYAPEPYAQRVRRFLATYKPAQRRTASLRLADLVSFLKSVWLLGVKDDARRTYWALLVYALRRYPQSFPVAVRLAVTGYHFRLDIAEYVK